LSVSPNSLPKFTQKILCGADIHLLRYKMINLAFITIIQTNKVKRKGTTTKKRKGKNSKNTIKKNGCQDD
jgi:hypothetical protein